MADLNFYNIIVPPFLRYLDNVTDILKKGEAWAKENNVSEETVLAKRLVPDMAALAFQVQRFTDSMKFTCIRIAKVENVAMEDNEKTFADLYARIDKTRKFLEGVPKNAFDGVKASDEIVWKMAGEDRMLHPLDYVTGMAMPNVLFHVTTTYALLRHQGVPVGKGDYLGNIPKTSK